MRNMVPIVNFFTKQNYLCYDNVRLIFQNGNSNVEVSVEKNRNLVTICLLVHADTFHCSLDYGN